MIVKFVSCKKPLKKKGQTLKKFEVSKIMYKRFSEIWKILGKFSGHFAKVYNFADKGKVSQAFNFLSVCSV